MKQLVFSEAIVIANGHQFILKDCVAQISKDLRLDVDWMPEEPTTVDSIIIHLEKALENLLFNSEAIIHQLLYAPYDFLITF